MLEFCSEWEQGDEDGYFCIQEGLADMSPTQHSALTPTLNHWEKAEKWAFASSSWGWREAEEKPEVYRPKHKFKPPPNRPTGGQHGHREENTLPG